MAENVVEVQAAIGLVAEELIEMGKNSELADERPWSFEELFKGVFPSHIHVL